jgi:cytochrome c556
MNTVGVSGSHGPWHRAFLNLEMSMLRIVAVVTALAAGATLVHAQSASIGQRKEAFKAMGAAAKTPGGMMKGDVKFDMGPVKAALKTYQEQSAKLKTLFPDDSKTGGETKALAVIWEKKADFNGIFDKLITAAKAAETSIKDEASFKTEYPKVMANCGACHKVYREAPKK